MKRWITAALCCGLLLAVCGVAFADQDFTFAAKEYTIFEGETLELELLRQGGALDGEVTWKSSAQKTAAINAKTTFFIFSPRLFICNCPALL